MSPKRICAQRSLHIAEKKYAFTLQPVVTPTWKAIIQSSQIIDRFMTRNLANCFFGPLVWKMREDARYVWVRKTDYLFADLVYVSEKEAPIEMRIIHRNRTQCKQHAQLSYLKIQENNPLPSRGINGLLHVCSIMICLFLAFISTKF